MREWGCSRDANHSDFCGIIWIFKADYRITISNVKITANNDFKMVPDKITGVTPTSTLVIPDASSTMRELAERLLIGTYLYS